MDRPNLVWVNLYKATPEQADALTAFIQRMTAIMFVLAGIVLLSARSSPSRTPASARGTSASPQRSSPGA